MVVEVYEGAFQKVNARVVDLLRPWLGGIV